MRKRIAFLLVLCMIPCFCYADIDLSSMSFTELSELNTKVVYTMLQSNDWFSVTVPMGLYQVGVDIPAGRYTVETIPTQQYTIVKWGKLKDYGISASTGGSEFIYGKEHKSNSESDPTSLNLMLTDGQWIEIEHADAIFYPFAATFSFK